MTGTVKKIGQSVCEVEVRENWGIRVVILDGGKERVVWGRELLRCSKNHYGVEQPYQARKHHELNRKLLKGVKEGTVVSYPCGKEYKQTKVVRVVRTGSWQHVLYTVKSSRCLHKESVRLTKKMIERARRENLIWGQGIRRAPTTLQERHVVSVDTFNHLRKWIFDTDFLEPMKASEQSTERGHCFAVKEAAATTFPRYQQDADRAGVDPVTLYLGMCFCFTAHVYTPIPHVNLTLTLVLTLTKMQVWIPSPKGYTGAW